MCLTEKQRAFLGGYIHFGSVDAACIASGLALSREYPVTGFYTYLLTDPQGRIFYVGKGKGARMLSHAKRAHGTSDRNSLKASRIREIAASGGKVVALVFSTHTTESSAFAVERALIAELRDGVTNIVGGCRSSWEVSTAAAQHLCTKIATYEQWLARARPDQLAYAINQGGTTRGGYEKMKSEMLEFAASMQRTVAEKMKCPA